jgi:hypothetical protein
MAYEYVVLFCVFIGGVGAPVVEDYPSYFFDLKDAGPCAGLFVVGWDTDEDFQFFSTTLDIFYYVLDEINSLHF